MTEEEVQRLIAIENAGTITEEDKKILSGVHFCPEWDFLPIFYKNPQTRRK